MGTKCFDAVTDYARDFLGFLEQEHGLFEKGEADRHLNRVLRVGFRRIRSALDDEVKRIVRIRGGMSGAGVQRLAGRVIGGEWRRLRNAARLDCFREVNASAFVRAHKVEIEKARREVFEALPLSRSARTRLVGIAADLILRKWFVGPNSGVVVAGFGNHEHFPSLSSVLVDGLVDGKLRRVPYLDRSISVTGTASIIPFAQQEMVHTFMEGVDPDYQGVLDGLLNEVFRLLPERIVAVVLRGSGTARKPVKDKLRASCAKLLNDLRQRAREYRVNRHVRPVIDAVAILPKDELAAMAESLVNLTSFKRRMSMELETVGGPIDVAVISKGDGFIWIKRKHYFEPGLNPSFLANYYRDASREADREGRAKEAPPGGDRSHTAREADREG